MRDETKALFTIGQFAALHEINKKTLMWYDEIGLFSPDCIGENGYRYYSYQQSTALKTILMLRELNVSLEEIGEFMKQRTADSLDALFQKRLTELNQMISQLKSIQTVLLNYHHDMENLRALNLPSISIIEKQRAYMVTAEITTDYPLKKKLQQLVSNAQKYQLHRHPDVSHGAIIPVENLCHKNHGGYTALFMEISCPLSKKGLHVQPSGTYLSLFYKGNWGQLPAKYPEILSFANHHGFSLCGHAYERCINELVVSNTDEYIMQIEIPVQRQISCSH